MEYSVPNNQTATKQTRVDRTTRVTADDTPSRCKLLKQHEQGKVRRFLQVINISTSPTLNTRHFTIY
jgi:hypothetical protein